jgi:hypothetical protein
MLDNVPEHLSFSFQLVSFSFVEHSPNLLYLVLLVVIFLEWLITTPEIKTSACIHHMSLLHSIIFYYLIVTLHSQQNFMES